ncbi:MULTISPECIES: glycosyltransferase family A protein [Oleiagrimonas]|uniref:Glycosyltransferase family 2 protein n=1 Tax=Oleiagrimonas citrea TaxID=1665687 RepID=A0A846ZP60_9GAMM|nr:glycosyltransferase family A protein [Oleiagrimonas sp. MCCC 1A03011]NKZ39816.1 glycosyltransferase family 2 protein [Oleiagrimonas citrea]RAP56874.1 glycosyl transferase family 2 [Oleiagrimonas sp. MCCC 1A03011]
MSASTSFSVVITSYNYRAYIEQAIEGVLAQSRAAMQLIVVDDGSTDGTPDLLRQRYGEDARVTLLLGENGGQLVAFLRGLAACTGDVVCFLDADDHWSADYLARIGALYDKRPDIDYVFSDLQLFGDENCWMGYADRALDLGYTAVSTYMLAHWYGAPTSALSLRRAMAQQVLDLPQDMVRTWRLSADNCLVFGTSILGGRKYYLPTGQVHYRIHGKNGWWGQRTRVNEYLNRMRSRYLIQHYARRIGLDETCLESAKHEFKTKPEPTWREARRYAMLVRMRRDIWWRNLERAAAILWSVWKRRSRIAKEYRDLR